jgi:hypothetical protein
MIMITRNTILTVLGIVLAGFTAGNALAQSPFVATYDFASVTTSSGTNDPTAPPTVAGLTFDPFVAVGYTGNPGAAGRFSWNGNPTGGTNGVDDFTQFTGSLTPTAYFEVSVTPLGSIELQLDTIAFTAQRSGTGIRNYAVRSSVDGFAANLPASISPANANLAVGPGDEFQWVLDSVTTAQNGSLVTLGAPHTNLTTKVSFRFYGWNAEGPAGTFSLDNVVLAGKTRTVPEPAAGSLLALGLAAAGFWRRHASQPR